MSYDEKAAERVRKALSGWRGVSEKKMFGGIAFMLNGAMCCGILKDDLIVRVGKALDAKALAQPHARPFDSPESRWPVSSMSTLPDTEAARRSENGSAGARSTRQPPRRRRRRKRPGRNAASYGFTPSSGR